jgi:hypothetical protein
MDRRCEDELFVVSLWAWQRLQVAVKLPLGESGRRLFVAASPLATTLGRLLLLAVAFYVTKAATNVSNKIPPTTSRNLHP